MDNLTKADKLRLQQPVAIDQVLKNASAMQLHLEPHLKKQNVWNIWLAMIVAGGNVFLLLARNIFIVVLLAVYCFKEIHEGNIVDKLLEFIFRTAGDNWALLIICTTIILLFFIKKKSN